MFARRYFAGRYFAPRYFSQSTGFVPPPGPSVFWCAWTGNSAMTGGGNLPGELG